MFNYLRYELHKTLKSKTFWILLIVAFVLRFSDYILAIINGAVHPIMSYYSGRSNPIEYVMPIIGVMLATKDFSSGFIKNIYKQIKPYIFVLSKFITLVAYVLIIMLIDFILLLFLNLGFGVEENLICNKDFPFSIWFLLTICFYYVTSGSIGMAIGFLVKNPPIAISIVLIWILVYELVYPIIGELVMLIDPNILMRPGDSIALVYNIRYYLHFGDYMSCSNVIMHYIRGLIRPENVPYWIKSAVVFYVKEVVFNVVAYIISWLSLKFRKV